MVGKFKMLVGASAICAISLAPLSTLGISAASASSSSVSSTSLDNKKAKKKADTAVTKATIASIANFTAAGVAVGDLVGRSSVKGPKKWRLKAIGSIQVPRHYTAYWNTEKGYICVQGKTGTSGFWKYTDKFSKGKC